MYLRKFISIAGFSFFTLNLSLAVAGELEDNIKEFCQPIIKEQCLNGTCTGLEQPTLNNALYNSCVLEQTDLVTLRDNSILIKDLKPKSNAGFLMVFGKLTIWAMDNANIKTQTDFDIAKKEFSDLKASYNSFLDTEYMTLDTFMAKNSIAVKQEKIEQAKIKEKIVLANRRLNFMLQNLEALRHYKETKDKILPIIVIPGSNNIFKNKKFTSYECQFLEVNFSKKVIKELKEELNFSCEEK